MWAAHRPPAVRGFEGGAGVKYTRREIESEIFGSFERFRQRV